MFGRKTKSLGALAIDGVLCISLETRDDRRAILTREFAESGLSIEFVLVKKDVEDPQRGCFNSHLDCARMALERGYGRVLILEDDATLEAFSSAAVERINNFLARRNPEMFYLGVTLGKMWLTWSPGVARVRGQGAHAYMLSAAACRKLVELPPYSGKGIDNYFSKIFDGFCAFPMISQQQPDELGASDIQFFRDGGKGFDEAFWRQNKRRQYAQVARNFGKSLIHKGF